MNFSTLAELLLQNKIENASFEANVLWDEFCPECQRDREIPQMIEDRLRDAVKNAPSITHCNI